MLGVKIEKGIKEWQVLQQEDGIAKIFLAGSYERRFDPEQEENASENVRIYAMAASEETGEPVVWWQECEVKGDKWSTELAIPAGGPYTIHTSMTEIKGETWSEWGTRGDIIQHICVGDLYVIAGQSNSAGYGKDFIYDPPEFGVHIYKNNKSWTLATHPLQDSTGCIDNPPNIDAGNTGYSMYLSFAKYLKRELNYPIGLIQTSQGGSPMSEWNPNEKGSLYRNMVERINECGGKVKAVIWYQGCSETSAENCETYLKRFSEMKDSLCKDLDMKNLPFVVFQISYCNDGEENMEANRIWGSVREDIRKMARELENVYVIPTTDATFSDQIHISALFHLELGKRAAKMILAKLFGKNYMCEAPNIRSAKKTGDNSVELSFDNVYESLKIGAWGESLAIACQDKDGMIYSTSCMAAERSKLIIEFERTFGEDAVIHGGYTKIKKGILPMDFATHMPMLSFYGVKIEQ